MIYRVPELNVDKDKLVVVHCAGRTRSIVGAQTLIDSGLFNNVVSLHNGTLAWQFEGFATEDGNRNVLPAPANRSAEAANRSARNIRETWAIPSLSPQELDSWRRQDGTRYVLDVRTEAEFARGHIPGARHVPGGQLLQTTDRHIAVQNSHIALVDSDGVRAVTAAMWLSRMGWEKVVTCTIPTESLGLATGLQLAHEPSPLVKISIEKAATQLASETAIVCDVRSSVAYRRGHVARAGYLSRAEPERDFPRIPASREILLMAEDLAYASLVGRDLIAFGRAVRLIDGDLAAWTAAGHPTAQGAEWLISRPIDTYFEGDHFEEPQIRDRENRAYLNWEIALIDHIVGDPAVRYAIHKS
jgi:rhodanese-related sulfurtransferase